MRNVILKICLIWVFVFIAIAVFIRCTERGRRLWREYHDPEYIDDRITDEQRKEVEETCRSLIRLWETQLSEYQKTHTEEAKNKANETARTYNRFLLNNGYVFGGVGMPIDIYAAIFEIE